MEKMAINSSPIVPAMATKTSGRREKFIFEASFSITISVKVWLSEYFSSFPENLRIFFSGSSKESKTATKSISENVSNSFISNGIIKRKNEKNTSHMTMSVIRAAIPFGILNRLYFSFVSQTTRGLPKKERIREIRIYVTMVLKYHTRKIRKIPPAIRRMF